MDNVFKKRVYLQGLAVAVVALFVVSGIVQAASTIGANISTTGTLSVSPASNSTTVVTVKNVAGTPVFDVDTTNSLASTTALTVNGAVIASSTLGVTGVTTLYNTLNATTTSITADDVASAVLTVQQDNATSNIVTMKDGSTNVFTLDPTGLVVVQPSANSTIALSVKNATGLPILDVDTTNSLASTTALTVNGATIASSTLGVTGVTTLYNTLNATTTSITADDVSAAVLTVRQDDATSNIVTMQDGATEVLTIGPTGLVVVQPSANSTIALSVKNATGLPIFDVDTTNSRASTTEVIVPQANANTPRFNASSTAVSIGDGEPIAGLRFGTCVVDVPALGGSNASSSVATCSAIGVTSSDRVFVNVISTSSAFIFKSASSTTDSIQIAVEADGSNVEAGGNPDASTWEWMAIR